MSQETGLWSVRRPREVSLGPFQILPSVTHSRPPDFVLNNNNTPNQSFAFHLLLPWIVATTY